MFCCFTIWYRSTRIDLFIAHCLRFNFSIIPFSICFRFRPPRLSLAVLPLCCLSACLSPRLISFPTFIRVSYCRYVIVRSIYYTYENGTYVKCTMNLKITIVLCFPFTFDSLTPSLDTTSTVLVVLYYTSLYRIVVLVQRKLDHRWWFYHCWCKQAIKSNQIQSSPIQY